MGSLAGQPREQQDRRNDRISQSRRQLVAKKRAIDQQRDGDQRHNASEDGPPVPVPRGDSDHNGGGERQQIEQKEEKRFAVFRAAQRRTKRGHHEVVTCSLGRAE